MEISEVRIKLVPNSTERLRAFCSVTLDADFVIRDLKIIEGANGVFVAMPSRKLADRCPRCGCKNHLRAKFCNECGVRLKENRAPKDPQGRAKLHADVAHPINAACRERIQGAVIAAYQEELEKSKSPDYRPPSFDDFEDDFVDAPEEIAAPAPVAPARGPRVVEKDAEALDADFSDYNALIADLRRDAAGRRREPDADSSPEEVEQTSPPRNTNGRKLPPVRGDAPGFRSTESREPAPSAGTTGGSTSGSSRGESDNDFGAGLV